jgi:hypothetical protein
VLGDTARHLADHYPVETWRPHQRAGYEVRQFYLRRGFAKPGLS